MVTEIWWVDGLIVAAAVVAAVSTIWVKAVRPIVRGVSHLAEVAPILNAIAAEFQPNHGSSLRDVVNRIERKADTAAKAAGEAATKAEAAASLAQSMAEASGLLGDGS